MTVGVMLEVKVVRYGLMLLGEGCKIWFDVSR